MLRESPRPVETSFNAATHPVMTSGFDRTASHLIRNAPAIKRAAATTIPPYQTHRKGAVGAGTGAAANSRDAGASVPCTLKSMSMGF